MLLPYSTDAPIYHLPIATVGLIVVNCAVFFATATAGIVLDPTNVELGRWILQFDQINPIQWLTNNFMHLDLMHLLGNMFFLWVCGLIVEGKLGWWRFLLLYLGMAIVYGALVQVPMYLFSSAEGGSLGASGVIFALLSVAIIWAAENTIACLLLIFLWVRTVELTVWTFGFIYLAIQIFIVILTGGRMSSAVLHLVGIAVGLPVGIVMLQRGWVDCEGEDAFTAWGLREQPAADHLPGQDRTTEQLQRDRDRQRQQIATSIADALAASNTVVAANIYRKYADLLHFGRHLDMQDLVRVVNALLMERDWQNACRPLVELLRVSSPQQAIPIRLKLAQIMITVEQRPRQGMAILAKIPSEVSRAAGGEVQKLQARAQQLIQEGTVELDLQDW